MEFETLDAEIEKGLIAILSKEFRRQVQLKEELSRKEGIPVLTWAPDCTGHLPAIVR